MNVKLIRSSSGEDLIANLIEETDEFVVLNDIILSIPTSTGKIGFIPWAPLLNRNEKDVKISKRFIVYIAELDEAISSQYKNMFSKIITPPQTIIQ